MNYWIFVSVPFTDYNVGTIYEMLEKIRNSKKWPLGKRTFHRKKLQAGDKVLFYQGGENGRMIVASAELSSALRHTENLHSFVKINRFRIWSNPIDIRELFNDLSFIKNKKHWSAYFQGGIVKISKEDYNRILRKAELAE